MEFDFANGSERQKDLWREGARHLLSIPFADLPLAVKVSFEDPSTFDGKHTDLAITKWTFGSTDSTMEVRGDFPEFDDYGGKLKSLIAEAAGMGLTFSHERFAIEVSAHELGHALFASLPKAVRVAIVRMFGGTSDDPEAINSEDVPWQQRIVEGIAETFKEAFLPAAYRVFPNRTQVRIPYSQYPKFRRLIRGYGGFSYVYGSSLHRVDLSAFGVSLPTHRSDRDDEALVFYQEIDGFEECWAVDMSQFPESGELPFSIEPEEGGET